MKCPACNYEDTKVAESRLCEGGAAVRRRRECPECGKRFTTYERAGETRLFVIKKDGSRQPFAREKILRGLTRACEKRPVASDALEALVDDIERTMRDGLAQELPTSDIGAIVMEKLKGIDHVAYVRFASVYKDFRDTESFVKEIKDLHEQGAADDGATSAEP